MIVDVGARWGAAESWRSLAPDLRVFGFDPDEPECARLNDLARASDDDTTTYVPVALGPRAERVDLYNTRQPACTSIYPPISELADQIPVLSEMDLESTTSVDLQPLDGWCAANELEYVDVLKLDTQGSELGVLQGAVRALSTCTLVQSEVQFNPLYTGVPLFADVDSFLKDHGFMLWRFDTLVHYTDDDVIPRLDAALTLQTDARSARARIGGGQLYWGDAVWVRRDLLFAPDTLDRADAERTARIVRAAGLPDLAVRIRPELGPELIAEARAARRGRRRARPTRTPRPARPPVSQPPIGQPAIDFLRRAGKRARGFAWRR